MKKILITGGVAGGASFAARMRRLDETAEIIMFERGDFISFANCGLPYHIAEIIKNRQNLIIQTPESFSTRFRVDVRTGSKVISVDTVNRKVTVKSGNSTYEESYDYLVLSPGAAPIRPPIEGIDNQRIVTLRNIPDMDKIKRLVDAGQVREAVIVGGGFIGLEMAEALKERGTEVTLVEAADQVFAPADPEMAASVSQQLKLHKVKLFLSDGVRKFSSESDGKVRVFLNSGRSIDADLVVLSIGVRPDTAFLAQSGIKLNSKGAIIVDEQMRTSAENVYALGDAVEVTDFVTGEKTHIPLAGPANRQGRLIADLISGRDVKYSHTQGTSICKIFDLSAATTGLNEKNARAKNIPYLKSYTHSSSHASYYPGASPVSIKLIFSPGDGRVLGAQATGTKGVDKRIDVLATAVRHRLTVNDLADLELAYAPPYGSAKDPVNIAGYVAQNILNGLTPACYAEDIPQLKNEGYVLLDVRTKVEYEQGNIPGSVNIPIDELREKLTELDKSKPVVAYCQVGLRGHLATRLLIQNGFTAKNLSGGYRTYCAYFPEDNAADTKQSASQDVRDDGTIVSSSLQEPEVITIDACGLQCPGPVMKLKEGLDRIAENETVKIKATDPGFAADIPSWCKRTGNTLLDMKIDNGVYSALVRKGSQTNKCLLPQDIRSSKTMVIFSNDFDKMVAAFIIANGAASMGSSVTMFFTFWGLNLLRKVKNVKVRKTLLEKMFGMMMPKGPSKLTLSKMNMGGMGGAMIRYIMRKKNVYSLQTLMEEAMRNGVRLVACTMSMDIMGIKKEELIDGVEFGGVASYLNVADSSGYNLFI
jgi:NADPH-dependent 2,4-dienoyl-CoA reductase/sulfur reductase-like enzyme/peroxiredoxin family protein/rhodanese-related sulfurtransferase/TusA-related sulfurtransferase